MSRSFALLVLSTAASFFFSLPAPTQEQGRKYALLIGVEKYEGTGFRNLSHAEKDVTDLAAALEKQGYLVTVLTQTESKAREKEFLMPTAANIRDHLFYVMRNRRPIDTVLVAFSGHGALIEGRNNLHFCPTGTKLTDPKTLVALTDMMSVFKDCKAGSKILLMDAWRNDPGGAAGIPNELKSTTRPAMPDMPGGVAAMFGCAKGQMAYESDAFGRGFLFHHVIEGLSGKAANKRGQVTWLGLAKYVDEELPEAVKKEKGPKAAQTPEIKGDQPSVVLASAFGK